MKKGIKIVKNLTAEPGTSPDPNTGVSMTEQGADESIEMLLHRLASGQKPQQRKPVFFDVEDIEQISKFNRSSFDLTDLDEMKYRKNVLDQAIKNAEKNKKKAEKEKEEKAQQELELEEKPKPKEEDE